MTKKFHITAFSKGLYSNWFWHHPSRTLFDIGEGFATYAGNHIFGVERICISHAIHGDHIGGLATFLGIRNSSRGDKEKPLDIYYPADDAAIHDYIHFISKRFGSWLSFKVNWIPTEVGCKFQLDAHHWIETFKLHHTKKSTTLGYKIVEARTRLKKEYVGKHIPTLLKVGVTSKDFSESYTANMLAYCLDAYDLDSNDIANAELAIMDCSFLNAKDRDESTHFTLDEALNRAWEAKVKHVAIAHISSRYSPKDIADAVYKLDESRIVVHPNKINEF